MTRPRSGKSFLLWIPTVIMTLSVIFSLVYLITDNDFSLLIESKFAMFPLLSSFIIVYLAIAIISIPTWRFLLHRHGIHRPFSDDFKIFCYTQLGSILPGRIWTMAGRIAFYQQLNAKGDRVMQASVFESLLTGVAGIFLYLVLARFQPDLNLWDISPLTGIAIGLGTLILLHPRILGFIAHKTLFFKGKKPSQDIIQLRFIDILRVTFFEAVVTVLGGLAIFVFISSLSNIAPTLLIPVVAAWSASVATASLLFWIPGIPIVRDGALVLALNPYFPLPQAILYVAAIRAWITISILFLAGLTWVILDSKIILNPID